MDHRITVNREELSVGDSKKWISEISQCNASVHIDSVGTNIREEYWYDARSGLWGFNGGPIQGKEFVTQEFKKNNRIDCS